MTVLKDIPITLDPERLTRELMPGKDPRPELIEAAEEAIAQARTLLRPAAAYDWYDVRSVSEAGIVLDALGRNVALQIGPRADLLQDARRVMLGVVTIGRELDDHAQALRNRGNHLASYMIDSVGVVALAEVSQTLRQMVEDHAAELEWGVGASMSPGSLAEWPLSGQRDICSLLDLEAIELELTEDFLLRPFKSVSMVIGIGPGYSAKKVGSVCRFCLHQKTCWRRRAD